MRSFKDENSFTVNNVLRCMQNKIGMIDKNENEHKRGISNGLTWDSN